MQMPKKQRSISKGIVEIKENSSNRKLNDIPTTSENTNNPKIKTNIFIKKDDDKLKTTAGMGIFNNKLSSGLQNSANMNNTKTNFKLDSIKTQITQLNQMNQNNQMNNLKKQIPNLNASINKNLPPSYNINNKESKSYFSPVKKEISLSKAKPINLNKSLTKLPSANISHNHSKSNIIQDSSNISNNILPKDNFFQANRMIKEISFTKDDKDKQTSSCNISKLEYNQSIPQLERLLDTKPKLSTNADTQDNCSLESVINQSKSKLNQSKTSNSQNIQNPEDLHYFYVKTIQSNKDYIYLFEKEE